MDLFGLRLEDLNPIRLGHNVYIDWEESMRCLVVKSGKYTHAEANVMQALGEVRHSYKSAKARKLSGEPLYIATPPTASGMRSFLKPNKYREGLTMIGLVGDKMPTKMKEEWKSYRESAKRENYTIFHYHLSKTVLALAPHKGWMRMRVHFGHCDMQFFPTDFLKGGSFQRFEGILKMPRAQATATFDKK